MVSICFGACLILLLVKKCSLQLPEVTIALVPKSPSSDLSVAAYPWIQRIPASKASIDRSHPSVPAVVAGGTPEDLPLTAAVGGLDLANPADVEVGQRLVTLDRWDS